MAGQCVRTDFHLMSLRTKAIHLAASALGAYDQGPTTKDQFFIIGNEAPRVKPAPTVRSVKITSFFNSLEDLLVPTSTTPAGRKSTRFPAAHLQHRSGEYRCRATPEGGDGGVRSPACLRTGQETTEGTAQNCGGDRCRHRSD